jgi:hypothetical protein
MTKFSNNPNNNKKYSFITSVNKIGWYTMTPISDMLSKR